MAQIKKDFGDDVRYVFRHYPLIGTPERPFHDKASLSHRAAQAAGNQGKFWEMHDLLFQRQSEWAQMPVDEFETWVTAEAEGLGLDVDRFVEEMNSQELIDMMQTAWDEAVALGIPGTPFIVVNGSVWPQNMPLDYANIESIVNLVKLEERQFTSCPPMEIDTSKQYIATLHTTKGDIKIELFAKEAPLAVNSFIFLARSGWFDHVMFHRVIPDFVAQSGDPTASGYGGPGYAFDNEISPDLKFDRAGMVGMANSGEGSNGSQFFITYAPTPNLDGKFTLFGQVIQGMDVAEELTPRNPQQAGELPEGDYIESVTIEEK